MSEIHRKTNEPSKVKEQKKLSTIVYHNLLFFRKRNNFMEATQTLVTIENSIPLADSREIANQLDIEHDNFFALIKKYEDEVSKDFEPILFQTGLGIPGRGGKLPKWALLTEDQTYVYLAYSQNTEQARRCKRLLVKAFAEARIQITQPQPTSALPEPAFNFKLNLTVNGPYDIKRNQLILAQAERLRCMVTDESQNQRSVVRDSDPQDKFQKTLREPKPKLTLEEEILDHTAKLQAKKGIHPSAADLKNYIKQYPVHEIENMCESLTINGVLDREKTSHTVRYSLK